MHPALSHLPRKSLDILETSVRPKFNAYFAFTQNLPRAVPNTPHAGFTYPDNSVMSDLTILASLFGEIDQAFKDHSTRSDFASALAGDANLREDFRQIVEGDIGQGANGSFWITGSGGLERVSADDTIQHHLESLLRTLRNGFAHVHWRYDNLSAQDYWAAQNWSTQGAPAVFDLNNRPPKNYMTYIADGNSFDPNRFWYLRDLRILVTPVTYLRYFLHLNLQQLLNNTRVNIFGNPV
jgi:hypothetical protein